MTMNNIESSKIDRLIDASEHIGVIGSPSSTNNLSLDILGSAVTKKLVGELALFKFIQDGNQHYAIGQITGISLKNSWHEDPTMRSLIRQRGRIDAVSARQDTHLGEMTVSAVFARHGGNYRPSMLGTVPATGTPIHLVNDEVLDELLSPYKEQLFYLGHVYGSTPKLPLWFKHFGSGSNGTGEAYHLGIFGKTGSGKSVLAKMVMLAYSRQKSMGLFILDPQGEFSIGLRDQSYPKNMGRILSPTLLRTQNRDLQLYNLTNIQLDRWELLTQLLVEFRFFFELGIKSTDYQTAVAEHVETFLRAGKNYTLAGLDDNVFLDVIQSIHDNIQRVYGTSGGVDRVRGFLDEVANRIRNKEAHPAKARWDRTVRFFKTRERSKSPKDIVRAALGAANSTTNRRPMVVVDLSERPVDISQGDWDDKIKPLLIDRFIDALIMEAETAYHSEQSLNTLVVLDEAHRLAPNERTRNERTERIKSHLVDAVRTTRKYGLGWMFLSQTLSSLSNEIVQQLRIFFFGFGLSMGTEYQKLRELVGDKESINLYQRFRDPQSSFDVASRDYSFMSIGPVSPLSFSGTPLFLNAFNDVESFVEANNLSVQRELFDGTE